MFFNEVQVSMSGRGADFGQQAVAFQCMADDQVAALDYCASRDLVSLSECGFSRQHRRWLRFRYCALRTNRLMSVKDLQLRTRPPQRASLQTLRIEVAITVARCEIAAVIFSTTRLEKEQRAL